MILQIADELPLHSVFTFAQTCHTMRNILKDRCGLDYSNLLRHRYQALQYLMCHARDVPNRWVCEHCVKFHAVRFNDFPLLQLPDRVVGRWPLWLGATTYRHPSLLRERVSLHVGVWWAFLHVWQDLGAEEAIVHVCCGTGRRKGELGYGSVRALYESVDQD